VRKNEMIKSYKQFHSESKEYKKQSEEYGEGKRKENVNRKS
jgi:hypothetical protein